MNKEVNQTKLISSLAVFRELYNSHKDTNEIISTFILSVIKTNALYTFDLIKISDLLNETYEFEIPTAVVNSVLSKTEGIDRCNGICKFTNVSSELNDDVIQIMNKNEAENLNIINGLVEFVEKKKNFKITGKRKHSLQEAFCSFVLNTNNDNEYNEYISAYIISNSQDILFKKQLENIKEGVILYSGLKYSNEFLDFSKWEKELIIYCDVEILFHLAGYNGELYQSFAIDFINLVAEINEKSSRELIIVKYFREVKREIDGFFTKAKYLLEENDQIDPSNTAMNTILNGCFYLSDVLEKKTDFYILLEDYNIYEEDYIDFFSPENQKYNIINEELIIDMKNEYNNNTEDILKFINYISILRKGEKSRRIENAGFLLLTGTSETLKISKDNRIKEKDIFYFATNLFFITDKLWNGINRGFGNSVFPKSFNIISKAQTVLSTIMRNKISDKYTELKKEVRDGKLTEELAVARLIDLRNYARKPEELDFESIDKALFIITEDKIDNFIQEQTLVKINLEKQNHTIAALNEEIKDKDKILSKYMKSITESISEKEEILNDLNNKKQKIDFRIKIYSGIFKLSIVFFICFYYFLILKFKLILPEFKMDIITIVLLPLPFIINTIYTFIFMKSFNPLKTVSNIENLIEKKVYSRSNNTLYKITKLKDEIVLLKLGIEEI